MYVPMRSWIVRVSVLSVCPSVCLSLRTADADDITHDVLLKLPPLVDAVLNESLRLYPVGAVNRRALSADTQVGPYMLPKVHPPSLICFRFG